MKGACSRATRSGHFCSAAVTRLIDLLIVDRSVGSAAWHARRCSSTAARSRRAEGHKGLLPLVLFWAGAGDGPLPCPPDESGDRLVSLRLPVAACVHLVSLWLWR